MMRQIASTLPGPLREAPNEEEESTTRRLQMGLMFARTEPDGAHAVALRLAELGQDEAAERLWRTIALHHPLHVPTQAALATLERRRGEETVAQARLDLIAELHAPRLDRIA